MAEPDPSAVERDALQRLLEFNHFPALYLHAQWPERLPHTDLVRKLIRLRARSQALSRYLFGCFGVTAPALVRLEDAFHRVLLMDLTGLQRTLADVGALLKLNEVRESIEGSLIRRRIKDVDPASLERVSERMEPLRDALNEVTRIGALHRSDLSRLRVATVGQITLAAALGTEPPAIARRMGMKLGPAFWRLHESIEDRASAPSCRRLVAAFA